MEKDKNFGTRLKLGILLLAICFLIGYLFIAFSQNNPNLTAMGKSIRAVAGWAVIALGVVLFILCIRKPKSQRKTKETSEE